MKKKVAQYGTGAVLVLALGVIVLWPGALRMPVVSQPLNSNEAEQESILSVLFVGDIMLDRAVAVQARTFGDHTLFGQVSELFTSADLVVGNLEGAITSNDSIAQKDHTILRFTFDPRMAAFLRGVGFDAVSLANNHALDFGAEGYAETLRYLAEAGIASFGHPLNTKDLSVSVSASGSTLCLVGYHSLFDPDPTWVEAEIKKLRPTCTYVAVMAHWGEEYQHQPTAHQQRVARAFIDLGVDVVIGAHPHIVQPVEIYRNRAIFYSLGNFLFDQAFQPEVKRGVAVRIEFATSTMRFTLTPVNTFKQVSFADTDTAEAVLADLGVDGFSFELSR